MPTKLPHDLIQQLIKHRTEITKHRDEIHKIFLDVESHLNSNGGAVLFVAFVFNCLESADFGLENLDEGIKLLKDYEESS